MDERKRLWVRSGEGQDVVHWQKVPETVHVVQRLENVDALFNKYLTNRDTDGALNQGNEVILSSHLLRLPLRAVAYTARREYSEPGSAQQKFSAAIDRPRQLSFWQQGRAAKNAREIPGAKTSGRRRRTWWSNDGCRRWSSSNAPGVD